MWVSGMGRHAPYAHPVTQLDNISSLEFAYKGNGTYDPKT